MAIIDDGYRREDRRPLPNPTGIFQCLLINDESISGWVFDGPLEAGAAVGRPAEETTGGE